MLRAVSRRSRAIGGCWVAALVWLGAASALGAPGRPGLSARFLPAAATIDRDLTLSIEVDDPSEVIQRAEIELLRNERGRWKKRQADRSPRSGGLSVWSTTFTSTTVWEPGGIAARQPESLLVRAKLYGRRGGLILSLGELDPLEVDVFTPAESEAAAKIFGPASEGEGEDELRVVGYVGTEAKAGVSARVRGVIGVGGGLSPRLELLAYVSVGPAFEEPSGLRGGGPLTLGFELSLRAFTRRPGAGDLALFAEPFVMTDLRLPGVDPGAGLRAGIQVPLGRLVELEAAIGGALTYFTTDEVVLAASTSASALALQPTHSTIGFTGGLRIGLRFGGDRPPETP